jgi:hypothetical protein
MRTLTADHDGIEIAYQRFGFIGRSVAADHGHRRRHALPARRFFAIPLPATAFRWHGSTTATAVNPPTSTGRARRIVAGCAGIPTPPPTAWRTWPTTRPRSSTPLALLALPRCGELTAAHILGETAGDPCQKRGAVSAASWSRARCRRLWGRSETPVEICRSVPRRRSPAPPRPRVHG